jgi:hypothetical protein
MHTPYVTIEAEAHVKFSGIYFERLISLLLEQSDDKFTTFACGNLLLIPYFDNSKSLETPIHWKVQAHSLKKPYPSLDVLAKPYVELLEQEKREQVPYTGPDTLYMLYDQDSQTSAWFATGIVAGNKTIAKGIQAELAKKRWDTFEIRPVPVYMSVEDFKKRKPPT